MLDIKKGDPPKIFKDFCSQPGVTYDDLNAPTKAALRKSLLKEQFYLCAYCMGRIWDKQPKNKNSAQIEHWIAQSDDASYDLSYPHLLAVCPQNK